MPRGGLAILALAALVVLAGCAAIETGPYEFNVSPAPVPDFQTEPEPEPDATPIEPAPNESAPADTPRFFRDDPARLATQHRLSLPSSYTATIHHLETRADGDVLVEWEITIMVDRANDTRHITMELVGAVPEHRFGAQHIRDEVFITDTHAVRRVVVDDRTTVQSNVTPYTPVFMLSSHTFLWADVAADPDRVGEMERRYFETFQFEIVDEQIHHDTRDPMQRGFRPGVRHYHLAADGAQDPYWLARSPDVSFPHNTTATAVVADNGIILEYHLSYTEIRHIGPVDVSRSVTYSDLGTTTIATPDWYQDPREPPPDTDE